LIEKLFDEINENYFLSARKIFESMLEFYVLKHEEARK